MSKGLRINSPEALERFLEIVVEEATSNAYSREKKVQQKFAEEALHEEDPEDEKDPLFADDGGGDEGGDEGGDDELFADDGDDGGDDGGGGGELDLDGPSGGDEENNGEGLAKQKQQGDAYEVTPTPLDLDLGKITPEGISSTINLIRAGQSFKDPAVASQLRTYVDSLSDAESLALGTFLTAIRDIAVGSNAQEAPDPSDPEVNVSVKPQQQRQEDQPEQQPQQQQQAEPEQQQQAQQPQQQQQQAPEQPESGDLEDTDAPIQVGRRNENVERDDEFRKHIRELIRNG